MNPQLSQIVGSIHIYVVRVEACHNSSKHSLLVMKVARDMFWKWCMWGKISVNDNCYSECYKLTLNLGFTGFQYLYNVAICIVSYIKIAFKAFI